MFKHLFITLMVSLVPVSTFNKEKVLGAFSKY